MSQAIVVVSTVVVTRDGIKVKRTHGAIWNGWTGPGGNQGDRCCDGDAVVRYSEASGIRNTLIGVFATLTVNRCIVVSANNTSVGFRADWAASGLVNSSGCGEARVGINARIGTNDGVEFQGAKTVSRRR